jgi:transportin-3
MHRPLPNSLPPRHFVQRYIPSQLVVLQSRIDVLRQVTYDLHQVDPANQLRLRDTLITALEQFCAGPKTIIVQVCLALSGLALQLPSWSNAVQSLIDKFGRNPTTVPVLLQFLTVFPEELASNSKIPVTVSLVIGLRAGPDRFHLAGRRIQAAMLDPSFRQLQETSRAVVDVQSGLWWVVLYSSLRSSYDRLSGVTHAVQAQILDCLRSWLVAGEVAAMDLAETPLLAFAFEALA